MRLDPLCLIALLVACGAAPPPPPTYDDLELEGALRARDRGARRGGDQPHELAPRAGATSASVARVEASGEPGSGRIDLAVRDADVRDVLRMIAVAAGVGLVVSDEVHGTVTLEVRRVTWRQALDVIAHLEGLTVTDEDGVMLVTRAPR